MSAHAHANCQRKHGSDVYERSRRCMRRPHPRPPLPCRTSAFEDWLEGKLDGIAPGIARETENWLRILRDGGPRTRPRNIHTVRQYARAVRPVLLDWSTRYDHLREVTRENVLEALAPLHGTDRQNTLIVLRSLFGFCKKNGVVFRNPTSRIWVGNRHSKLIQPLRDDQVQRTVAGARRPADHRSRRDPRRPNWCDPPYGSMMSTSATGAWSSRGESGHSTTSPTSSCSTG